MTSLSNTPPTRRLSASRLKLLSDCTWRFYASEYLLWPEKVWPRTHLGTIAHAVLEALYRDRHRKTHDAIKEAGTIYVSPSVSRLVRILQVKLNISDELIADIDPMVMLALTQTNFLDVGAIRRFDPEHEFTMTLPSGGKVRGYIDKMAEYSDEWIVWDFKSQKNRFTKDELDDSFQSMTYQWYVYRTFGKLATVKYVMLRHPPTNRTPEKHIQITPPATPEQLEGFESYLDYIHGQINQFGLQEARSGMKTDDDGFCRNVCSYFTPKTYISIRKKSTKELVKNYLPEFAPQPKEDEYAEEAHHSGCPRWNS
jgi:hypothetical protein